MVRAGKAAVRADQRLAAAYGISVSGDGIAFDAVRWALGELSLFADDRSKSRLSDLARDMDIEYGTLLNFLRVSTAFKPSREQLTVRSQ
jgi:hypothetical protein